MRRPIALIIGAAAAAAAIWAYASQPKKLPFVAIEDEKTIDFSGGSPKVSQSAADKADMDAQVKQMDAAAKDVTFPANPPTK